MMSLLCSVISLFVIIRLLLWVRFNNPSQHGGFLQLATFYRDNGHLEAAYDFYPSWKKHPLSVIEYQGFYHLLGLFLRVTKLPAFRGAQVFQLLLAVILAWSLSLIMPEGLPVFSYLALSAGIAPLYLSVIITPDLFLMTATGMTLYVLCNQPSIEPWLLALFLGSLGWAGIRIKSSGLILSMSILVITPFCISEWGPFSTVTALTFFPLLWDVYSKKKNAILHLVLAHLKVFGYTLEDEQAGTLPSELRYRKLHDRLYSFFHILMNGYYAALNPFHKFSLFRSSGWFYVLGLAGMVQSLFQHPNGAVFVILIFSWSYILFALTFFSISRRYYHFAGRAGGTLMSIWVVWTGHLVASMGVWGQIMVSALLMVEGFKSLKRIISPKDTILCEPIHSANPRADEVISLLREIIKPRDLLFLTYKDISHFGLALGVWQAVIELEKATVPVVCKYIDYYTHDKRYDSIYLVLPPDTAVFFDRDRKYHYIEEPEFASRFKQIHQSNDLNGYRIFEAIRPYYCRDLSPYEGLSTDQLKNMPIDFGALKPVT